jgi:hypothetical protein
MPASEMDWRTCTVTMKCGEAENGITPLPVFDGLYRTFLET